MSGCRVAIGRTPRFAILQDRRARQAGSATVDPGHDEQFFKRADAHIHLANDQIKDANRGKVSASLMYATARFNAWVTACEADSGDDLRSGKDESIEYFVAQYRSMLEENLKAYIENFDRYMRPKGGDA
jgi:hypothetical protein